MSQRWILVTGATGGIGQAIAQRLAKDGFSILAHYNSNREKAKTCQDEIQKLGARCEILGFDVSDSKAVEQSMDQVMEKMDGILFGVVNNAGLHIDTMAGLMSDDDFDKVLQTNLYGAFFVMRYALKKMMRNRQGSIVNISSLSGQVGNPGQINYSASKAGLIAMTKTLSMELARRNIRVNAVSPGLIETSMVNETPGLEEMIQRIPMRRMGQPHEVAGAVSFLMSEDASYMTGQTVSVNGGLFPG
ncbi:MAG: 3-oxoacyl-ACP reductase FabG [Pseudomonadota bacterium]